MTLGNVATKARSLAHQDTSSWTDANLLIDINIWYEKIWNMILESQDESDADDTRNTNYPIQTTPMIASQRDYSMPVSELVLKIKRVDVTYDGTHWFKAEPFDDGEFAFGMGSDSEIDANFATTTPRYDIKYNSVWLYPMPSATDVANGGSIRTEWERDLTVFITSDYSSVLTDSTVKLGFDPTWHPAVAEGAAFEKAKADNLPQLQSFAQNMADWEARIRAAYGKKELDRRLALVPDYQTYH